MGARRIFVSDAAERSFRSNGFCVLSGVVTTDKIKEIRRIVPDGEETSHNGFYVTNWDRSHDQGRIHRTISEALATIAARHLINYRPVLGAFAIKPPSQGDGSIMETHQDWSFTDESRFDPVSLWIPLQDVNESNGCLEFVPGSHQVFRNVRGLNITPPIDHLKDELAPRMVSVPVRMGDVLVLHSRVVHRSGRNRSSVPRIAAMLAMIPNDAPVMAFARSEEQAWNEMNIYRCPDDFYLTHDISGLPNLSPVGTRTDRCLAADPDMARDQYLKPLADVDTKLA